MTQFSLSSLAQPLWQIPVAQAARQREASSNSSGADGAVLPPSAVPVAMPATTATETSTATPTEHPGLSIQASTVLAHGLNFVLLLVLLNLILYKPLTKLLADREKKIREGVENAEKAEVMINEAGMTKANILKQASVESQNMMEKARQAGESLKASLVDEAHQEADHIVKSGQQAVAMERAKALEDIQTRATTIIVGATERILRKKLDLQADAELIRESLQQYSS